MDCAFIPFLVSVLRVIEEACEWIYDEFADATSRVRGESGRVY